MSQVPSQSSGTAILLLGIGGLVGLFGIMQLFQLLGFFGIGFSAIGLALTAGSLALSFVCLKAAFS